MTRATPEMIAAAWAAWHSRHGGKLGPGPAFVEAINAALAKMETPAMSHGRDNLRPHAEARLAMAYYGKEYAAQKGGCMDFWDALSPARQELITRILDETLKAMKENGRAADWKGSQP